MQDNVALTNCTKGYFLIAQQTLCDNNRGSMHSLLTVAVSAHIDVHSHALLLQQCLHNYPLHYMCLLANDISLPTNTFEAQP